MRTGASCRARRTARRFDLDDVGAEVAEQTAGQLAAFDRAVDDAQSGQGQGAREVTESLIAHLTTPLSGRAESAQSWLLFALVRLSVGAGCSGSGAPFTVCWIHLTVVPSL